MVSYNIKKLAAGQVLPDNGIDIIGYGRINLTGSDASCICSSAEWTRIKKIAHIGSACTASHT